MSRVLFVSMNEAEVAARCAKEKVGLSAIESLPGGGVRFVCMSGDGAERMRTVFKSKLIQGNVVRALRRPVSPTW